MAERILRSIRELHLRWPGDIRRPVTVSVGLACRSQRQVKTMSSLISEADAAIYTAKNAGRNRLSASSPWVQVRVA